MFPMFVIATPVFHFVLVAAVAIGFLFPFTYRSWHKETHDLMQKLAEQGTLAPRDQDDEFITAASLKQRIEKLPKVVQQYLESTLSLHCHNTTDATDYDKRIIPFARALRIAVDTFYCHPRIFCKTDTSWLCVGCCDENIIFPFSWHFVDSDPG